MTNKINKNNKNTKANSKNIANVKKQNSTEKVKNEITKQNDKKNTIMNILILLGVAILCFVTVYLMNYFFVKHNNINTNYSTDKQLSEIQIEGQSEIISTQKYISDLGYNMRYDINNFVVFKHNNKDYYKFKHNDNVIVKVESSSVPTNCTNQVLETTLNNCYRKLDNYTEEYYITSNSKTFKVTIKSPNSSEYTSSVRTRIEIMLETFKVD